MNLIQFISPQQLPLRVWFGRAQLVSTAPERLTVKVTAPHAGHCALKWLLKARSSKLRNNLLKIKGGYNFLIFKRSIKI
jgi:hypothetical protein